MNKLFYSIFILLVFSISCKGQSAVSVMSADWNNDIDQKSRSEIKLLDDQIISAFYESKPSQLVSMYSDRLQKEAESKTEGFVDKVNSIIKTRDYTLLDEYLYRSSSIGSPGTVFKSTSEDNSYSINFNVYSKETYVSLMVIKGLTRAFLITALYGKYDASWKIDAIRVGLYKVFDKNAVDYYNLAKKFFSNGDLFDAEINVKMTRQLIFPAESFFVYFKMKEMKAFADSLASEGKSKLALPLKVPQINSAPQIFDFEPVVTSEGVFPTIKYSTTIKLEDTVALRNENDQIKNGIGKIFPGILSSNKYIFFKAYNELPNGKTPVKTFGFILKKGDY